MCIFTGNSDFFCINMHLNEQKYSTLCKVRETGLARVHEFKFEYVLDIERNINVTIIC